MITIATKAGGLAPNEDWVGATDQVLVVLDGLSAPEGVGGCEHGTPWYVAQLGHRLLLHAANEACSLRDALAESIREVAALHQDTCDLKDAGTPSSTVTVARRIEDHLEGLVLADSTIVVETKEGIDVLTDSRVDATLADQTSAALESVGREQDRAVAELVRAQRAIRNAADGSGYWVAQANPEVAQEAFTRTWDTPVTRCAAMTDGAARPVDLMERFSWTQLLDLISKRGPEALLSATRALEDSDPAGQLWPRFKRSDDATVAYWEEVTSERV